MALTMGQKIGTALCKAVGIDVQETSVKSIAVHFDANNVAVMLIQVYINQQQEETIERVFKAVQWGPTEEASNQ